jgi:hypothetical protein
MVTLGALGGKVTELYTNPTYM